MNATVNSNSMTEPSRVVNSVRFMPPASMVNGFHEGSTISIRIALRDGEDHLKVEAQFSCVVSRSNEVRATESRQKVEECGFVCQVDGSKTQAPLVTITVKEVVVAHCGVKEIPRRDAGWIVVHVKRPKFRKNYSRCTARWLTIREYITS